jgi:hypothetical protein
VGADPGKRSDQDCPEYGENGRWSLAGWREWWWSRENSVGFWRATCHIAWPGWHHRHFYRFSLRVVTFGGNRHADWCGPGSLYTTLRHLGRPPRRHRYGRQKSVAPARHRLDAARTVTFDVERAPQIGELDRKVVIFNGETRPGDVHNFLARHDRTLSFDQQEEYLKGATANLHVTFVAVRADPQQNPRRLIQQKIIEPERP